MEHEIPVQQQLQAAFAQIATDRIRLEALIARIDALHVPIDRAELQEELDVLSNQLLALQARVSRLEAPDPLPSGSSTPRPRGVIGALRSERDKPDDRPTPE